VLVFTTQPADSLRARALRRAGVEVARVRSRDTRPDLRAVVEELGRREILSALLEAGGELNAAALAAGVVDKMFLFYAPRMAEAITGRRSNARPHVPSTACAKKLVLAPVRAGFCRGRLPARCLPESLKHVGFVESLERRSEGGRIWIRAAKIAPAWNKERALR